jgi:folate-binding protein YgfZ
MAEATRAEDATLEYRHALKTAALFDLSFETKIEVGGEDAAGFLHNLSTNDVRGLASGAGCEAFFTNSQAKIMAHALIFRSPQLGRNPEYWLDAAPGTAGRVIGHLNHYLVTERVEIVDRSAEWAQLHVAGPEAAQIVEEAFGQRVGDLRELGCLRMEKPDSGSLQLRRHDRLGLPGYEIIGPTSAAREYCNRLIAAGARPAGSHTGEILRVEAGTPVYGIDLDETNLPQEIGRTERAVSFTKGCYIGQETVARIRTYGHVNRSLIGLRVAGVEAVPRGAHVVREGKEVGTVTSCVTSPRFGVIALAYVRRGAEETGTVLEVAAEEKRNRAEVVTLPFSSQTAGDTE